ncbi:glycoside hydrolase family 36 protein [Flammeovirga sp. OC4]|uniref:glycoside hydrolase family 36 protein n=1 Tax=Flammeovirga sp. OC4 TaxID=1382345 RepID=UPI0006949089|nr:glycoside hydrolase family 36 protein [Flammeovirga sp. OC4]
MKLKNFLLSAITIFLVWGCGNTKLEGDQKFAINNSAKAKLFRERLEKSPSVLDDKDGNVIPSSDYKLSRKWEGNICKTVLTNTSDKVINPKEVIIFTLEEHGINPDSPVYGEGFQMLHQNGGTLGKHENRGSNSDKGHYRMKELRDIPTVYGLLNINVDEEENFMLGFTSCKKFIGRIAYDQNQMLIAVDAEGLALAPGESWNLEDFIFIDGENQGDLYDEMSDEIVKNHPAMKSEKMPIGWCSWYCYKEDITDEIMMKNLDIFAKKVPEMEYIQLDDGYQPYMGDWLDPNPAYGDVRKTIDGIAAKGFKPAIWVAPFIAQKESRVFKEHPEWFVKGKDGQPLNSSTVTFGGWREGPWYCLDGTHPEVQAHLTHVIKTMREEWGVNYFKLDANYWGAIQDGAFYDKSATRIEAYRRGMEAILKGCDDQSVVLGCNAPIWPSLGLVTAQRTSADINRKWSNFRKLAIQNLSRCWQNEKVWDADPDCIVQTADSPFGGNPKEITKDEWFFHLTSIHAVGGFSLGSDKAELMTDEDFKILKKLLKPTGKGAKFKNSKLEVGVTDLGDTQYYYVFNWTEEPIDMNVELIKGAKLTDFWTDKEIGEFEEKYTVKQLAPHAAKLLMATKVDSQLGK